MNENLNSLSLQFKDCAILKNKTVSFKVLLEPYWVDAKSFPKS